MFNRVKTGTAAKWSVLLVGLVVVICLWQRAGFSSICPLSADAFEAIQSDNASGSLADEQCDLSDQMLQSQLQSLDQAIFFFPVILLILAWLLFKPTVFLSFTEPIVPTRRQHLILCVFQE